MTNPSLLLLLTITTLSSLPTLQSFALRPPTTRQLRSPHRSSTRSFSSFSRRYNRQPHLPQSSLRFAKPGDTDNNNDGTVDEYRNIATAFLSNFLQPQNTDSRAPSSTATTTATTNATAATSREILSKIDFQAPKAPKMPIETLASLLDRELYEKEWFVTGNVNPIYFDDKFKFQDPDVKVTGVEEYAKGVQKIFDQTTSRAQIISTVPSATVPNTITVTWRLSGRVNIGPSGLPIKPYICYTDFTIDEESGLIVFQEDRFDIPGWDILISALFPFLVGRVGFLREAAEEVEERVFDDEDVVDGSSGGRFEVFGGILKNFGF